MFVAKRWVSPYLLTPKKKKKKKRKTHGCSGEWVITFMTVKVAIDRGTIDQIIARSLLSWPLSYSE